MPRAVWNGQVIAECDVTKVVEGNHYFPRDGVNSDFLTPSDTRSECGWKGTAEYFHINVGKETNEDAAWFYPDPKPEAAHVADCVAFWKGVKIESGADE